MGGEPAAAEASVTLQQPEARRAFSSWMEQIDGYKEAEKEDHQNGMALNTQGFTSLSISWVFRAC